MGGHRDSSQSIQADQIKMRDDKPPRSNPGFFMPIPVANILPSGFQPHL